MANGWASLGSIASSGSPLTLNATAAIQAGDLVVVGVAIENSATPGQSTACTDGTNTYTFIEGENNPGGSFRTELWYCANCKAVASPAIKVTFDGSYSSTSVCAVRIPGAKTSSPLDKKGVGGAQSGNPSIATGTLSQAFEVIVGMTYANVSTGITPQSGFTQVLTYVLDTVDADLEISIVNSTSSVTFAPSFTSTIYTSCMATFELMSVVKQPLKTYLRR